MITNHVGHFGGVSDTLLPLPVIVSTCLANLFDNSELYQLISEEIFVDLTLHLGKEAAGAGLL